MKSLKKIDQNELKSLEESKEVDDNFENIPLPTNDMLTVIRF